MRVRVCTILSALEDKKNSLSLSSGTERLYFVCYRACVVFYTHGATRTYLLEQKLRVCCGINIGITFSDEICSG